MADLSIPSARAERVLGVPELLELILCQLVDWPFTQISSKRSYRDGDCLKNIHNCSLVCQYWNDVVNNSLRLDRLLWNFRGKGTLPAEGYDYTVPGSKIRTFAKPGEVLPAICYPFMSWLAQSIESISGQEFSGGTRQLRKMIITEKFPNCYFSSPPTTNVFLVFGGLRFRIPIEIRCRRGDAALKFTGSRVRPPNYIIEELILSNDEGVTVEDIVECICRLMEGPERRIPTVEDEGNWFESIRIGVFKETTQQDKLGWKSWYTTTRSGIINVRKKGEVQDYIISDRFKVFSQQF
ncbi:hypothetical protein ABW19_dt0210590 [Dactylella cylindrospora]|nr:hypothetical protein ABW19_dt0210590 [Dactylella cylindrospora]